MDFEKAFDSLSWKFIHQALEKFNFGPNFRKWIHMFQKGSKSKVILNGHLSESFELQRGCRQGDPISPYLFILCSEYLTLALKNERNLEGITINRRERKCSQYADDTSIFLKSTENNLKLCLSILNWFYQISGLKINIQKTKVIKLGPIRETDRRFCRENDLEWVSEFVALGIKYDVNNMQNITIMNMEEKIDSMKNLMQSWLYRNITPIGRVCIVKSLVMSKVIHILQALPTPTNEYFKKLEALFLNFIWKNKRHEINKDLLAEKIDSGGLNMISLQEMDIGLKLTWLRKMVASSPEWLDLAKTYKIDRLITTDTTYHIWLQNYTQNPFWKSVIIAYTKWFQKLKEISTIETADQPIWGNLNIDVPFDNILFSNNIIYIKDLYDIDGTPLSREALERNTGKKIMFTSYIGIWQAIPRIWKNEMHNTPKTYEATRPVSVQWLMKDKKGTKNIREVFHQQTPLNLPKGQIKWKEEFNLGDDCNWKYLYTLSNTCKLNARIMYFQFQILHRTLITNKKLYQFNIKESDHCEHCDETDTIVHLLYECRRIGDLWNDVETWLNTVLTKPVKMDLPSIILGNNGNEYITNQILTVVKHEIYKSKWTKSSISLIKIQKILKSQMELDIYIATIKNSLPKTLGKWSGFYNVLRAL